MKNLVKAKEKYVDDALAGYDFYDYDYVVDHDDDHAMTFEEAFLKLYRTTYNGLMNCVSAGLSWKMLGY